MASTPDDRPPPEERKQQIRFEMTERTLELTIAWVYALREKLEQVEQTVTEQSIAPLEARIARLESELRHLRGYLKAAGIKPPAPVTTELVEAVPTVVLDRVPMPEARGPAFEPPPPELFRTVQALTRAEWGPPRPAAGARSMTVLLDGYSDGTPAAFRVFRRDLDIPIAVVAAVVRDGDLEAEWEHGDVSNMVASEDGPIELYFEVQIDQRKTVSPARPHTEFSPPQATEPPAADAKGDEDDAPAGGNEGDDGVEDDGAPRTE